MSESVAALSPTDDAQHSWPMSVMGPQPGRRRSDRPGAVLVTQKYPYDSE